MAVLFYHEYSRRPTPNESARKLSIPLFVICEEAFDYMQAHHAHVNVYSRGFCLGSGHSVKTGGDKWTLKW